MLNLKFLLLMSASLGLAGCSYVHSARVSPAEIGKGSITYALQDSIVDIKLSDPAGGVKYRNISLVERTVADRNSQVAVRIQSNPVSTEKLIISVDERSNLLKSINSTVDGKLDEIIVEAARSIGRLRGAGFLSDNAGDGAVEVRTIASFRVGDPLEFAIASSEFRRRTGFGVACLEGCVNVDTLPPAKADAVIYYRTPAVMKLAFCSGDCKKETEYSIPTNMLTFRSVETFNSPNLVSFPIRGSAFGQVVDHITFTDGMPHTVKFDGESALLDIVKIPGAVVGALFAGISAGTGDRSSVIKAEKDFAEAKTAAANARKAEAEATKAELEAFDKLNCSRNPELCAQDKLPGGGGDVDLP